MLSRWFRALVSGSVSVGIAVVATMVPSMQASASPLNPPGNEFPGISLNAPYNSFHAWGPCTVQDYKDATVNGKTHQWVIVVYRSGHYFVVRNGMLWGWFDNLGGLGSLGCPTDNEWDGPAVNQYGTQNGTASATSAVQSFDHGDLYWVTGMNHAQALAAAQANVIEWAWKNWSNVNYDGNCLQFVADAYRLAANITLTNEPTAYTYWQTNPDGYIEHPADPNPATGSLVFWGPNPYTGAGHVGIFIGPSGAAAGVDDWVLSTASWPQDTTKSSDLPAHAFYFSARNSTDKKVYKYYQTGGWLMPVPAQGSPPTSLVSLRITTTSGTTPSSGNGVQETPGGGVNTWTDYADAGGAQGPTIPAHQAVVVSCRAQGFTVTDGDDWWYQIASSPWDNAYYGSADAFYNNGQTSGNLQGTPFFDPAVPLCATLPPPTAPVTPAPTAPPVTAPPVTAPPATSPPQTSPTPTYAETAGGVTHTWTDYSDAGGVQGASIASYQTVQVACAVQGFRVADGDTWWYRVATSPWDDSYYASADAFYNNGATSGSLHGTPFVDPAVPGC